jgi:hypothetical protein
MTRMPERKKTIKLTSDEELRLARKYREAYEAIQAEAAELHQRQQQEIATLNLRSRQILRPLFVKLTGGRIENPETAWESGEWFFNFFFGDFGDYYLVHMLRESAESDSEDEENEESNPAKLVIQ